MFYLVSIFWILSITGLLVLLTKKSFGNVCVFSFVFGTLLIYVFGFFNELRFAYYASYIGAITFWVLLIRTIKKDKKSFNEFLNNYFSISFFVFLVLLIYCFIKFKFKGYEFCDEFTHWGPMVIASLKVNGFYAQPQDILDFHQDYPPFFTLLECLWCGFDNFHFSETYTYIAINTFMFSCFLPIFEKLGLKRKKDIFKVIIGIVCVILVGITISKTDTSSDYAHVYTSIYVDWALAVFCAFSSFLIYKEKEWKISSYISICLCLITLILMKQIGLFFYLLMFLFVCIKMIFVDRKSLSKEMIVKSTIFFIVIPILVYLSWKAVINYYNLTGQFVISDLNIGSIFSIINGKTDLEWKTTTFYNFVEALLNRKIILYPLEMTYFAGGLVISAFVFLGGNNFRESFSLWITFVLGLVGYAVLMMLLYILAFGIDEAPILASFDRYMMCYLYFGITLSLLLDIEKGTEKQTAIYCLIVLLVLVLFVDKNEINEIVPNLSNEPSKVMKVLVVQQYGETNYHREKLKGLTFEFEPKYIMYGTLCNTDGFLSFESIDEWENILKEYDLMYIEGHDDFFYENCWLPLEQDGNMMCYNGWLYSIDVDEDGEITLSYNDKDFMYYARRYYTLNYEN